MQIEQKQNRIYKPQSNTTLSAEETNQVTTELENVIRAGNLTPNAGTLTQVRDAIQNVVDTAANELQEQIDAITSASDVFDVVGTYAQLQAYDTSTVPVNDIIKVLQDETRNNAMTYYRWNGTSWVFIGAEGPYYTKSEIDADFALKSELPVIATTSQVGLVKPDGQTTIIQQDGTLSVSSNVAAALPLFTSVWADHLLNNASYLRADTFSWQSGAVYISAYNHLVNDIAGKPVLTETVAGYTIGYYLADDGHKIVGPNYESTIDNLYNATGIAWYYVLDTTNQRFKLPRTKWGFIGYRDGVGNYVPESLPNITGNFYVADVIQDYNTLTGASKHSGAFDSFSADGGVDGRSWSPGYGGRWNFDASQSSSTYQNGAHVRQRATQMYLYFYVGNTVQDQTTIDVGQITEDLNGKADNDLANLTLSGYIRAGRMSMPSYTYTLLTPGASSYVAPSDGWVCARATSTVANGYVYGYADPSAYRYQICYAGAAQYKVAISFPVMRGSGFNIDVGGATFDWICFVYAEGSKSLA